MPATSASAPAKCILFGEHAVVYGKPAIAIPISDLKTHVYITASPKGKPGIQWLDAPNIQVKCFSNEISPDHPIRVAIQSVVNFFHMDHYPACEIKISSDIPIASGLGSSASTAVALIRGLTIFLGQTLDQSSVNQMAFSVEKIIHGNPSGIDNTVISFEKPVFYIKDSTIEFLKIKQPFNFVIADSGIKSLTKAVVSQVREMLTQQKSKYEGIFDRIGKIAQDARLSLLNGDRVSCGILMSNNHELLMSLGVSCDSLDYLVHAALEAGALGAKLCGSGQGGNMIVLINKDSDEVKMRNTLLAAGAVATYSTQLKSDK
jgi:mevalonate kinase